jgi:16S rRNA (cytosine1402-N4)-methyltransferase
MLYHKPVLLKQCVEWLAVKEGGIYVDVTFGGGGHSSAILKLLGPSGRLFAFDRDADSQVNVIDDQRLELIRSDFKFIERELKERGVESVDGILADLGISSHQVDTAERGFSFRFDAPLDMRMDQRQTLTAQEVVNQYAEEDLSRIFHHFGELPNARRAAKAVATKRLLQPLLTTGDLCDALEPCIPRGTKQSKYLSMAFQAIRLEVNGEMEGLDALLTAGTRLLGPGGRFVILSYHSLEDRKVKNLFRSGNLEGKEEKDLYGNSLSPLMLLTRKAVQPDEQEIADNPRARSARLRVAEKRR